MMPDLSLRTPDICLEKMLWTTFSVAILSISSLCFSGNAEAAPTPPITRQEYQVLPAYCRNQGLVSQSLYKPDNEAGWRQALGPDYRNIHHVCWGLVQVMRAHKYGLTSQQGRGQLSAAIADYNYTLERSPEGSFLRPEMLTRMGEAYVGLRDYSNAESVFKQALAEKPDHEPAYIWWAHFLMKNGKSRQALEVAEEGKKHIPNSKSLNKLIAEIKGSGKKQ